MPTSRRTPRWRRHGASTDRECLPRPWKRGGGLTGVIVWPYRSPGAGTAIGIMEALARIAHEPWSRVPFVTSIVLTLSMPESQAARPYSIIAGHLASRIAGFAAVWCCGPGETAGAVGVALAAMSMLVLQAMHPPADIDAFLITGYGLPMGWILSPVLVGAVLLAIYAATWAAWEPRVRHLASRVSPDVMLRRGWLPVRSRGRGESGCRPAPSGVPRPGASPPSAMNHT